MPLNRRWAGRNASALSSGLYIPVMSAGLHVRGHSLRPRLLRAALAAAIAITLSACGGGSTEAETTGRASETPAAEQPRFPEIVAVEAIESSAGVFDFAVTISSPYDSPERYADGWQVTTEDGEVLGEWTLLHDHATEQPFTRTQAGVMVPASVRKVVIEPHDLENGYGGEPYRVELPRP